MSTVKGRAVTSGHTFALVCDGQFGAQELLQVCSFMIVCSQEVGGGIVTSTSVLMKDVSFDGRCLLECASVGRGGNERNVTMDKNVVRLLPPSLRSDIFF